MKQFSVFISVITIGLLRQPSTFTTFASRFKAIENMESKFPLLRAKSRRKADIRKGVSLVLFVGYFGVMCAYFTLSSDYFTNIRGKDKLQNIVQVNSHHDWGGRMKRDINLVTDVTLQEGMLPDLHKHIIALSAS